jgi:site-specific recombinase XerD
MKPSHPTLDEIFEVRIQILATILRPNTVKQYRSCVRCFLTYLHATFPHLRKLSQLRREHLLSWFRSFAQQHPPLPPRRPRSATGLSTTARKHHLFRIRRLLHDLANDGHPLPHDLIRREDFPPDDHYLPRPLSPQEDERLQQQLRSMDTLEANALRLMRATGIRIGECIALPLDCLRQVRENETALHVPLGKLHSERLVPVDEETQRIVARILELRALAPRACLAKSHCFLLPRRGQRGPLYGILYQALIDAAQRAGCTSRITPHRLRHTYASEMLRLGVSLPALMQLLGHKDIRMTLRYVEVTLLDLQREFHRARQNTAALHSIPHLPLPSSTPPGRADLATIREAIAATHRLLQLFHLQLQDPAARRTLRRLTQRLLNISRELNAFAQE